MPKLRLFTQAMNPFSAKVELTLALKGLPYDKEVSSDPADIKRWSPVTGLLPVLEIDGTRIPDSTAILAALDERLNLVRAPKNPGGDLDGSRKLAAPHQLPDRRIRKRDDCQELRPRE